MAHVRAVDISRWQEGTVPQSWWSQLREQFDVGLAIIGAYTGSPTGFGPNASAEQWLTDAHAAGLKVAAYSLPAGNVLEALAACGSMVDHLDFMALDVEDGRGIRPEDVAAVQSAGLAPMVYSSASQWPAVMGVSEAFAEHPLWDAAYFDRWTETNWPLPDDLSGREIGYGGWSMARGWQCRGDIKVLDVNCDLSVFDLPEVGQNAAQGSLDEETVRQLADQEAAEAVAGHAAADTPRIRQIAREVAREVAAGQGPAIERTAAEAARLAVERYKQIHDREHEALEVFENAFRMIKRKDEPDVRRAMTLALVRFLRREGVASVPLPPGVEPEPGDEAPGDDNRGLEEKTHNM